MAGDRGEPHVLAAGEQREAGDRALTAFVVAVEQVDRDALAGVDGVTRLGEERVVGVS